MASYPRETNELQPVFVTVGGTRVYTSVELAVLHTGVRPIEADWSEALTVDGELAVRVAGLEPRSWNVWARVNTGTELVVVICGNFKVT